MATFANYTQLQTALLGVLGRAPDALVYQMVASEINRDLKLKEMEATTTATEAASVDLSAKDPKVLSIVQIYRDVDPRAPLQPATAQQIAREYQSAGIPRKFAFVNDTLLLDSPGAGETLNIRYIGALDDLATTATNDVLTTYPDIYFYGALFHHGMITGDPRTTTWGRSYIGAKDSAKSADRHNRHAGAPMTPSIMGATP